VNVVYLARLGTTANGVANDFESEWCNALDDIVATDFTWTGVEVREQIPTGLAVSKAFTHPGLNAAEAVPPGVALCMTLATTLGGRSHRGRWYIPGLGNNYVGGTDAQWDDGSGDLGDAANAIQSNFSGDGSTVQVYSRVLNDVTPVSDIQVKLPFASQRRRNT
jgi:hypothetical protein